MILYLQDLLFFDKKDIVKTGFKSDDEEEIPFFRTIKPQILGKLIHYNKVYRIERLFFDKIENLKWKYIEHICNSDFYRYYRLGRTD